jgi:hypothetical protein
MPVAGEWVSRIWATTEIHAAEVLLGAVAAMTAEVFLTAALMTGGSEFLPVMGRLSSAEFAEGNVRFSSTSDKLDCAAQASAKVIPAAWLFEAYPKKFEIVLGFAEFIVVSREMNTVESYTMLAVKRASEEPMLVEMEENRERF